MLAKLANDAAKVYEGIDHALAEAIRGCPKAEGAQKGGSRSVRTAL
ncbi:hypothetical protein SHIRM173S_09501 [Streptomyces hirsutus]